MKYKKFFFLFCINLFFFITLVSSVLVEQGTTLNATDRNITLTFNYTYVVAENLTVTNETIYLENAVCGNVNKEWGIIYLYIPDTNIDIINYCFDPTGDISTFSSRDSFFFIDLSQDSNLYFLIIFFAVSIALFFFGYKIPSAFMMLMGGLLLFFSDIHFLIALVPVCASIVIGGSN